MPGSRGFGLDCNVAFASLLIEKVAVATVPASSFFHDPALGKSQVRFSFPKRMETLNRGLDSLRALSPASS